MDVKIIAVEKELPAYSSNTKDILPFLDLWLHNKDERELKKAKKIFENANVDKRYAIMPPEHVFSRLTFEERNQIYAKEAVTLSKNVLKKALKNAALQPNDLDFIITISCTGIMIPSIDAHLINLLQLNQNINRLPVTEMGCVGGVSGLIYAYNFLKANPNKRAAVIAVESPTATFQWEDTSLTNIVSAAIFGDGAACAILSSSEKDIGPKIVDTSMYHFFDNIHMMGFQLTNTGLKMVLDVEVPETIATHFEKIIHPFLKKNDFDIQDIGHLIFHPGGKKIIQIVEDYFAPYKKEIQHTKNVLKNYGNMSSATILFVLKEVLETKTKKNEIGLILSFGPGFTAQQILIEW